MDKRTDAEKQYIEKWREPIQNFMNFSSQLEGKLTDEAMSNIRDAREMLPSMLEKGSLFISNTSGHICAGLNYERDIKNPQDYPVGSERYKLITQTIEYLTNIASVHKKAWLEFKKRSVANE